MRSAPVAGQSQEWGASSRHAYWALTQALSRDEVERANRRLADALGADPASADAASVVG